MAVQRAHCMALLYACVVTECHRVHTAGRKGDDAITTADAVTLCTAAQCNDGGCCIASAFTSGSRLPVHTGIKQDL